MVQVVLRQVARGRHSGRDRVSYERDWTLEPRQEGPREYVPVRVELSTWSVLGAQGKQGTHLAVGQLEFGNNMQTDGTYN